MATMTSMPRDIAVPLDTTPEAYAVQGEIYRRMTCEQRLAISFRLSADVRRISMAGIRARHPDYSTRDVQQAYARLVYGNDVAAALWPNDPRRDP